MFLAKFGRAHFSQSLLSFGWSQPEEQWVWSDGRLSVVTVPHYSCAKCRITMLIDVPPSLGSDAILRIAVNGLDYGERKYAPGQHKIVFDHEDRAPPQVEGLAISFYHLTCRAPAEVVGEDARLINISLKDLAVETLALRQVSEIPRFLSGSPGEAYFARREQDDYAQVTGTKWRLRDEMATRGPRQAVEFLLYGLGGNRYDRQFLMAALQDAAQATEAKPDLLQGEGLPKSFVGELCPEFASCVMASTGYGEVERTLVAEARANPLYDPRPLVEGDFHVPTLADQKTLPEEAIHTHKGADLIASPRQFMIFDRNRQAFFNGCNPAGLTLMSTDVDLFETAAPVAMVRDQFDASNVAHFLFDACLRIMNYCEAFPALRRQTLFVAGGTPGAFHALAVEALAALYDIPPENIMFPRSAVRIRSSYGISWFSDQVFDRHPCQRFRPEALERLKTLVRAMHDKVAPAPGRAGKIFVSRSDAAQRRLVNEDELLSVLRERGFQKIVMSEHSWADQIDLMANADVVVGPHGMGLTMLAFNLRQPRLVEIFNAEVGSGAYALMARAYGMDYHAVAGRQTDPGAFDYELSREEIDRVVALASR
jgi:hypothetical protein